MNVYKIKDDMYEYPQLIVVNGCAETAIKKYKEHNGAGIRIKSVELIGETNLVTP